MPRRDGLAPGLLKEEPTGSASAGPNRLVATSGQHKRHYGSKGVNFRRQRCADVMSLGFGVADVTRRLVALRRIVEKAMR